MLAGDWGWFLYFTSREKHSYTSVWFLKFDHFPEILNSEQSLAAARFQNLFGWSTKSDVNTGSHVWARYNHFLTLDYRSVFTLQQQGVEISLLCLFQLHPKYAPIVVSNPRYPDLQLEVGKGSTISRENCFLGNWESERWPHIRNE